jgi:hypothetical protein
VEREHFGRGVHLAEFPDGRVRVEEPLVEAQQWIPTHRFFPYNADWNSLAEIVGLPLPNLNKTHTFV